MLLDDFNYLVNVWQDDIDIANFFFLKLQRFQISCSSICYFSIDVLSTPPPPPPSPTFVVTNTSEKFLHIYAIEAPG